MMHYEYSVEGNRLDHALKSGSLSLTWPGSQLYNGTNQIPGAIYYVLASVALSLCSVLTLTEISAVGRIVRATTRQQ